MKKKTRSRITLSDLRDAAARGLSAAELLKEKDTRVRRVVLATVTKRRKLCIPEEMMDRFGARPGMQFIVKKTSKGFKLFLMPGPLLTNQGEEDGQDG